MKKRTVAIVALSIVTGVCMFAGACSGGKDGGKDGETLSALGNSADGVEMTSDWEASGGGFRTNGSETESVAFSKTMLNDYSFSYGVRLDGTSDEGDAKLGGYAYYVDASRYVSYELDPAEKTVKIVMADGFDSEERTNTFDASVDFSSFVNWKVEKIGSQFKFYLGGELIQSRVREASDAAQVGFKNLYASATYQNYSFTEISQFSEAEIGMKAFEQLAREGTGDCSWTVAEDEITAVTPQSWQSYVLQGQSTNMVLDVDVTRSAVDGNEPLAGVTVFTGLNDWCSLFVSPTHTEFYLDEKTYQGWSGGKAPSYGANETANVRVEKLGPRMMFFFNDDLFRVVDDETFTNALFGLESKHSTHTFKINRLEEIEAFSQDYDWEIVPNCNLTGEYDENNEGRYLFKESTGGLWGGATVQDPSFEGGLHVALGNLIAKNYTFETIVKLSQEETASGVVGVVAFWEFSGNCLFYLIDSATGNIDVGGSAITGTWAHQIRNIDEFGLTLEDEIPIKVERKSGSFTFYVNGQKATEYTHAYYSVGASFGFCGTAPAGSDTTGQFGAAWSGVRFTSDGFAYHTGAEDHRFSAWETVVAATCIVGGSEKRICHDCNKEETRDTDTAGHVEGNWTIETPATETTPGKRVKNCKVCGTQLDEEEIPVKTTETTFEAEQKEDYTYSFHVTSADGSENGWFGGYAYYKDEANNILFKLFPATGKMELVTTVESEEETVIYAAGSFSVTGTDVTVERIGSEFRFIVEGKLICSVTAEVEGAGKIGTAGAKDDAVFTARTLNDLTKFTLHDILFDGSNQKPYQINETGTWTANGNVISSDCTGSRTWYLFNYDNGKKPIGNIDDFSITFTADLGTDSSSGDPRAAVVLYNSSAYYLETYFYNKSNPGQIWYYGQPGYGKIGGADNFILYSEGAQWQAIPNYEAGAAITVKVEKVGNAAQVFINGTFVRAFSDPSVATAWVGIENKHALRTFTVTEYKAIDALTPVTHGFLPGMNMKLTGGDDNRYTFSEESPEGYWRGHDAEVPTLDGGAVNIALSDVLALDYTIETTVKLSQSENASGFAGVMGMWLAGNVKSWLEISEDGGIKVYQVDGYYSETHTLSDFGLTVADEIPVKVVKEGKTISYYVNGTLVVTATHDSLEINSHFGFLATSPALNSDKTGQYGAQFKIVSVTYGE